MPNNLFSDLPDQFPEELVNVLLKHRGVRIERIVSHGHASPVGFWYDQPENEWVALIQGAARLTFDDAKTIDLIAGSFIHIPAHQKHRVEWTDPAQLTIWLAIHYA